MSTWKHGYTPPHISLLIWFSTIFRHKLQYCVLEFWNLLLSNWRDRRTSLSYMLASEYLDTLLQSQSPSTLRPSLNFWHSFPIDTQRFVAHPLFFSWVNNELYMFFLLFFYQQMLVKQPNKKLMRSNHGPFCVVYYFLHRRFERLVLNKYTLYFCKTGILFPRTN